MVHGCDSVFHGFNSLCSLDFRCLKAQSSPNLQQPYIVKNLQILGCLLTQDVDVQSLLRHISFLCCFLHWSPNLQNLSDYVYRDLPFPDISFLLKYEFILKTQRFDVVGWVTTKVTSTDKNKIVVGIIGV